MPFFTLFILSTNSYNEFGVDRQVFPTLESTYRIGQSVLKSENVYGYVITKHNEDSWQVITQYAPGVDYTISEHNGRVDIHEVGAQFVMV